MAGFRNQVNIVLSRARIAHYERRVLDHDRADRAGQEHLERLRAGIKDNTFGLNGRWT
jgi:hypothetical protein